MTVCEHLETCYPVYDITINQVFVSKWYLMVSTVDGSEPLSRSPYVRDDEGSFR